MSKNIKKIHFIGVGGISMSALAKYCLEKGVKVSGSDRVNNEQTKQLKKLGAEIYIGHKESNVVKDYYNWDNWQHVNLKDVADLVVYSCAINKENKELVFAKNLGIKTIKRSEFLSLILNEHTNKIAISGSHGKTTTTSLISNVFIKAGKNPTVFVGGETLDYGNVKMGDKNYAIFEACEYNRNFLDLPTTMAVVLNIDNDHLDCYKSIEKEIEAFNQFIDKSKISIICLDDKNGRLCKNKNSITYAIDNKADYTAKNIKKDEKGYSFSVYKSGKSLGKINLSIDGRYNVYNALACVAVCDYYDVPFKYIKSGIQSFNGVKRRNEYVGKYKNKPVYCDYAHHPTEIEAIIKEYNDKSGKTCYIFQPHTYSRTKQLKNEFIDCFKNLQNVIIYQTYSAREKYLKEGSARTLFNEIEIQNNSCDKNLYYCACKNKLKESMSCLENKVERFLVLGAGDIYDVIKTIL